MTDYPVPLVSTAWLAARADDPAVIILDCTFHMPASGRDALAEFREAHIPGARFFDFDGRVKDPGSPLPHMLPDAARFTSEVGALGIDNDSFVVLYDALGLFSAARGWWMFRTFGHDRVSILDGGLPKWRRERRPLESAAPKITTKRFIATFRPELVADSDRVVRSLETHAATIIDARSADRFCGRVAEPRPGLRRGRIPGSANLPFTSLVDEHTGSVLRGAALDAVLAERKLDIIENVIVSCGSGVSSCIVALAYFLKGKPKVAVYDGSWSEWGADRDLPIQTGEPSA